MTTVGTHFER